MGRKSVTRKMKKKHNKKHADKKERSWFFRTYHKLRQNLGTGGKVKPRVIGKTIREAKEETKGKKRKGVRRK